MINKYKYRQCQEVFQSSSMEWPPLQVLSVAYPESEKFEKLQGSYPHFTWENTTSNSIDSNIVWSQSCGQMSEELRLINKALNLVSWWIAALLAVYE